MLRFPQALCSCPLLCKGKGGQRVNMQLLSRTVVSATWFVKSVFHGADSSFHVNGCCLSSLPSPLPRGHLTRTLTAVLPVSRTPCCPHSPPEDCAVPRGPRPGRTPAPREHPGEAALAAPQNQAEASAVAQGRWVGGAVVACSPVSHLHCPRSRTPVQLRPWKCRPVGDTATPASCVSPRTGETREAHRAAER